jgi:hypothetical protein
MVASRKTGGKPVRKSKRRELPDSERWSLSVSCASVVHQGIMNEEHDDFAAKLLQIEEQANMALNDLPAGLTRDRVQHIAIVARMLRYRLDVASIVVLPSRDSSRRSPS